jgi:hypothetical protein
MDSSLGKPLVCGPIRSPAPNGWANRCPGFGLCDMDPERPKELSAGQVRDVRDPGWVPVGCDDVDASHKGRPGWAIGR